MIYVLTDGHYDDYHIAGVLAGPDEPGFETLVRRFEAGFGVPEPSAFTPCPSGAGTQAVHDTYSQDRRRILSGRFGDQSHYRDALLLWLREEHDYHAVEWEGSCLPEF